MGTETTKGTSMDRVTVMFSLVKLNNPLMGTETHILYISTQYLRLIVKLNNPLMGTETPYLPLTEQF